jgi:hypothetical protein
VELRERVRMAGRLPAVLDASPPNDEDLAVILGRRRPGLAARLNRAAIQALTRDAAAALVDEHASASVEASSAAEDVAISIAGVAPIASRTRSRLAL